MKLSRTTDAATEPVTRAEAKLHLRLDSYDEDDLVDRLITAARQQCEQLAGRAFIEQTWTMYRDGFWTGKLYLPRPPLQSVTSIKYQDGNNAQQTLAAATYYVDTAAEPGAVSLAYQQTWPSTYGEVNDVEIIYVAGYGDEAADVPATDRQAILLAVGHLYEHREATLVGQAASVLPMGVRSLLAVEGIRDYR